MTVGVAHRDARLDLVLHRGCLERVVPGVTTGRCQSEQAEVGGRARSFELLGAYHPVDRHQVHDDVRPRILTEQCPSTDGGLQGQRVCRIGCHLTPSRRGDDAVLVHARYDRMRPERNKWGRGDRHEGRNEGVQGEQLQCQEPPWIDARRSNEPVAFVLIQHSSCCQVCGATMHHFEHQRSQVRGAQLRTQCIQQFSPVVFAERFESRLDARAHRSSQPG